MGGLRRGTELLYYLYLLRAPTVFFFTQMGGWHKQMPEILFSFKYQVMDLNIVVNDIFNEFYIFNINISLYIIFYGLECLDYTHSTFRYLPPFALNNFALGTQFINRFGLNSPYLIISPIRALNLLSNKRQRQTTFEAIQSQNVSRPTTPDQPLDPHRRKTLCRKTKKKAGKSHRHDIIIL